MFRQKSEQIFIKKILKFVGESCRDSFLRTGWCESISLQTSVLQIAVRTLSKGTYSDEHLPQAIFPAYLPNGFHPTVENSYVYFVFLRNEL